MVTSMCMPADTYLQPYEFIVTLPQHVPSRGVVCERQAASGQQPVDWQRMFTTVDNQHPAVTVSRRVHNVLAIYREYIGWM